MREFPTRWSAIVGLGANLGDREATLRSAARALRALGEARASDLYETAPIGPPQPSYLNAAVRIDVALAPETLLDTLLGIERAHGRERRERWGPRTLDLDVLYALDPQGTPRVWSSPTLVVPHPALLERAFALAPLLDVAPELEPSLGPVLAELGGRPPVSGHAAERPAEWPWAPGPGPRKGWTQGPRRK